MHTNKKEDSQCKFSEDFPEIGEEEILTTLEKKKNRANDSGGKLVIQTLKILYKCLDPKRNTNRLTRV